MEILTVRIELDDARRSAKVSIDTTHAYHEQVYPADNLLTRLETDVQNALRRVCNRIEHERRHGKPTYAANS